MFSTKNIWAYILSPTISRLFEAYESLIFYWSNMVIRQKHKMIHSLYALHYVLSMLFGKFSNNNKMKSTQGPKEEGKISVIKHQLSSVIKNKSPQMEGTVRVVVKQFCSL